MKKRREFFRFASLGLSLIAFLLVFFEFMLTTHGGWDDINMTIIFLTPLVAAIAMIIAIVNIVKNRARSHEIISALSVVVISSLFFCYVMVYSSTVLLASS